MIIQPFTDNDIPLLAPIQPADWQDITPFIKKYVSTDSCFPLKAVENDTMVGIGTLIIHGEIAWLAHIVVRPDKRNKGIGQLITQTLIETAHSKNCDTLLLIATELGAPVYEKAGFVTETDYLFFKEIKTGGAITSNYILPYKAVFKEALLALDRQVSGEERTVDLEEYLPDSFVYMRDGLVEGFYIPGFGEGLVSAITEAAGIALMNLRLATKNHLAFPTENIIAKNFLYQSGHKEFKTAKRMRLGKSINWQPENLYSRVGGNLG